MAKFATYIADSDLESRVIRAIHAVNGELAMRVVSREQLSALSSDLTLLSLSEVSYSGKQLVVEQNSTDDELILQLQPADDKPRFHFQKNNAKLICFLGLGGGVGTTSIAINYAFEKAEDSRVLLIDLDLTNPEIAISLGVHRIDQRMEQVSKNLHLTQGLPEQVDSELVVVDLGAELSHPILKVADVIYLVCRNTCGALFRLERLPVSPSAILINFAERSTIQKDFLVQLKTKCPRIEIATIPNDVKAFELSAKRKSALIEVARNSPARKSIATLG